MLFNISIFSFSFLFIVSKFHDVDSRVAIQIAAQK